MKKRFGTSLIAAVMAAALVLSGCGSSKQAETTAGTSTETKAEAGTTATAETKAETGGNGIHDPTTADFLSLGCTVGNKCEW